MLFRVRQRHEQMPQQFVRRRPVVRVHPEALVYKLASHQRPRPIWWKTDTMVVEQLDYLQQSSPKIQDSFVLWVALQVKKVLYLFLVFSNNKT